MNQAQVTHSAGKLFYKLSSKRRLSNPDGPKGRLRKIKKTITALFKYERLELNYGRADEVRGYAERLISEAIRHGPEHKETMDNANFFIGEKQLVHKLFKVLVPRYQDYDYNYTKVHKLPVLFGGKGIERAVLELRGNIFPRLETANPPEHILLHNVLLSEARKQFRVEKYKEIAENMEKNLSIKE